MSQRQARRARRKADAPATRQSSRRQRPGGNRNGSKTGPANPAPKQTPRQQSKAADGKDPAENEYSPAAEIVAAGNKTGRSTKAGQPTEKAGRWRKGRPAGSNADRLTENRPAGDDPAATKNREMRPGGCISPFYVIPERFERSTRSLEGCCSIQLSYGTIGAQGPKAPFADAKVGKIFHFRVLSAVSWMKTCPFSPNYFAARNFLSTFAGLKARRG